MSRDGRRRKLLQQRFGRQFLEVVVFWGKALVLWLESQRQGGQHSVQHVPAHDVSIRMMAAEGCRYRGCIPRSKNSITIMRPPQQGQGLRTVFAGSSLSMLASFCIGGGVEPSNYAPREVSYAPEY
jgi:hypothetical protein